jgi:hypothetical protein
MDRLQEGLNRKWKKIILENYQIKTKQNKSSSGLLMGKEIMQNLLSSRVI